MLRYTKIHELIKEISRTQNFLKITITVIGILIVIASCTVVLVNNLFAENNHSISINLIAFIAGSIISLLRRSLAIFLLVTLIPLMPNLQELIHEISGINLRSNVGIGIDLVSGFFLTSLVAKIASSQIRNIHTNPLKLLITRFQQLQQLWPLYCLLIVIFFSCFIAVVRNLRQTGSSTSLDGVTFNLINFRPIGWKDNFMPLADLVNYGVSVGLALLVFQGIAANNKIRNQIFQAIAISLTLSAGLGVIQSLTGLGLTSDMKLFRADSFGFVAVGTYPDIHSFASFMLLGGVGLIGYYISITKKIEKKFILIVITISWLALILTKSKSSIMLGLLALFMILFYLQRQKLKFIQKSSWKTMIVIGTCITLLILIFDGFFENQLMKLEALTQNFGERPELFRAALHMYSQYPIFGIGQGEFYRQSSIEGFSKSFLLSAWGGEHAHNYFLQALAEKGLIGIIVYLSVLIIPMLRIVNLKVAIPAIFALISLILGNIFGHSFLIRENLLIFSIFIGVIYSYQNQTNINKIFTKFKVINKYPILIYAAITIAAILSYSELKKGFYEFPFEVGKFCHINRPITDDNWTSGVYEIDLPNTAKSVLIDYKVARPNLNKVPVTVYIDIVDARKQSVISVKKIFSEASVDSINLEIPKDKFFISNEYQLAIKISNCFSPKDIGMSLDNRLLGIQISSLKFNY